MARDKEDEEVRKKLAYIYSYGITMFKKGYIDGEVLKEAVLTKIAARVGLDGAGLDQYLSMPAV